MSREEFVKLRMPENREGIAGYGLLELKGPWTRSTRAMAQALRKMSTPQALELLRSRVGFEGAWDISKSLESAAP